MAKFPEKAKVVTVGLGGIVGASVAHHLIERGWDDIVGIDKSAIPDGYRLDVACLRLSATRPAMTSCPAGQRSTRSISSRKCGRYAKVGGLEIARVGDDGRMDEIKRKVASAKAFGTRARLIDSAEIKEKFPLIEESLVQGGLWDPDAGLVIPRSQTVAGKLVDQAVKPAGKLQASPTRRP
jgi:glycine/D-amino acid oxidase-like deaminating enzyme